MEFDFTINISHILTILGFIVSLITIIIFWRIRLYNLENVLTNLVNKVDFYETERKLREEQLLIRLNRIDDKLDLKEDKGL